MAVDVEAWDLPRGGVRRSPLPSGFDGLGAVCSHSPYSQSMFDELFRGSVTDHSASSQDIGRQGGGKEPCGPGAIGRPVPGHVEQRCRGGPTDGSHQEIGGDVVSTRVDDGLHTLPALCLDHCFAVPRVEDSSDFDTRPLQIGDRFIT